MTKRRFRVVFIGLLITTIIYLYIQFASANNIDKNCIVSDFEQVFEKDGNLTLSKRYDFSEILDCKEWDKLIIAGGKNASRAAIFLKEGVAVPEIDYENRASGCLIFYVVKDEKLIAPPIEFWHPHFLYFQDFNNFDYISLTRKDAVFKCIKLDYIGSKGKQDLLTFQLVTE